MTLLLLSNPSGRASCLSSIAEQKHSMCLQSLYQLRKADKNQLSREKKGCFFPVTGWRRFPFQTNWCGGHGQRQTPETTPLRTGWTGCTTAWASWGHTGFAAFRKWHSTIGHPGPGTFGQSASEARAFHPTPLCLHSQWHKCTPDRNWAQNMPSWLTCQPASAKAQGGN